MTTPEPLAEARRLLDEVDRLHGAGEARAARTAAHRALALVEAGARPGWRDGALRFEAVLAAAHQDRIAGDLDTARTRCEEALALATARGGDRTVEAALAHNALGMVCKYAGDGDAGLAAYQAALAIAELLGDDELVVAVCHNLGGLAHELGRYEEGIAWAERGLALRRARGLADPLGMAADLGALAALADQLGRREEAAAAYREALATFEAELGPDHYEVAVVCGNLGRHLMLAGEATPAEEMLRRSLRIKERALGPDHTDNVVALVNLGRLLASTGRPDAARPLLERAVALARGGLRDGDRRAVAARAALAELDDGTSDRHGSAAPT